MLERTPAGEIPAEVRKIVVAWVRREHAGRQVIGARALPFDGGVLYHFRTDRPDDEPAVRIELVVNDDGSIQGPKRIGANERRRQAQAVRHVEGRPVKRRTRYMDTVYERRGWR